MSFSVIRINITDNHYWYSSRKHFWKLIEGSDAPFFFEDAEDSEGAADSVFSFPSAPLFLSSADADGDDSSRAVSASMKAPRATRAVATTRL